uniref:Organic cation transporter protein-like n=1 Tax=Saccoglossus kowalevskii TaxID=10224 RepID=A0ABM0MLZ4_SACKO|nr:PREDICTED: organic cation transporter protein-like [Saccoglossus kowalevskii]
MFAGIAVLTAAFSVHPMVSATFAVISKFFLSMSYVIVILITLEMLPTDIRNVGVGVTYAFSSIGTILAPFILKLDELWKPLPFIVFSFLLVVMGLLSLVLPETKNQNLPQNLDEFEAIIGFSKAINKKPKQNDSTIGLMLKAETPSV